MIISDCATATGQREQNDLPNRLHVYRWKRAKYQLHWGSWMDTSHRIPQEGMAAYIYDSESVICCH